MHSQSALTEHVSPNLAGIFLLNPVIMTTKNLFRRNWAFADSIEVLCSSWDLAKDINGKRRSEAAKLISTLEAKHNFSVNFQMADNFMCRGVSCFF